MHDWIQVDWVSIGSSPERRLPKSFCLWGSHWICEVRLDISWEILLERIQLKELRFFLCLFQISRHSRWSRTLILVIRVSGLYTIKLLPRAHFLFPCSPILLFGCVCTLLWRGGGPKFCICIFFHIDLQMGFASCRFSHFGIHVPLNFYNFNPNFSLPVLLNLSK